jgi:LysM repeat protein
MPTNALPVFAYALLNRVKTVYIMSIIRKKPPIFLIFLLLNMAWVVSACSVNNAPVTHHGINQRGHTPPLNARGTVTNADYTVKRGDTLHSIARTNNVPLRDLISANNVSPPYTLRVGQRLTLPVPRSYQVARGDTLYSISRRFQVDMNTLARTNNLRAPYTVAC